MDFNADAANGIAMEGYLYKRASNAFKTWSRCKWTHQIIFKGLILWYMFFKHYFSAPGVGFQFKKISWCIRRNSRYFFFLICQQSWTNVCERVCERTQMLHVFTSLLRTSPQWWWRTCVCAQWSPALKMSGGSALKSFPRQSECVCVCIFGLICFNLFWFLM